MKYRLMFMLYTSECSVTELICRNADNTDLYGSKTVKQYIWKYTNSLFDQELDQKIDDNSKMWSNKNQGNLNRSCLQMEKNLEQ